MKVADSGRTGTEHKGGIDPRSDRGSIKERYQSRINIMNTSRPTRGRSLHLMELKSSSSSESGLRACASKDRQLRPM